MFLGYLQLVVNFQFNFFFFFGYVQLTVNSLFLCFAPYSDIDHETFSTVILSLPLIQEGQLSVSGERMCTVLVNRLED